MGAITYIIVAILKCITKHGGVLDEDLGSRWWACFDYDRDFMFQEHRIALILQLIYLKLLIFLLMCTTWHTNPIWWLLCSPLCP
jgi:hypothetical protein